MLSIENSGKVQTVPSSFMSTLWKPRNERNGGFVKSSGLRGKRSAGPQKRPTVMKELKLRRGKASSCMLVNHGELQRAIQAMEVRCNRKILRISYKDHVTNAKVRAKIQQANGPPKT